MQILKESLPEFNQFVPRDPHYQEVSLDKLAAMQKACREMPTLFNEWKDADGSVFSTLGEWENHQAIKFCNKYPPNFVRLIRPELAVIDGTKLSWNLEAVKINMKDAYGWSLILRQIENVILKWAHFDFEKVEFDENLPDIKRKAVDEAIELFYEEYKKLTSEVK